MIARGESAPGATGAVPHIAEGHEAVCFKSGNVPGECKDSVAIMCRRSEMNVRRAQEKRWQAMMTDARSGDSESYKRLLMELLPVLRRLVSAKWPNAHDNEDIVQEILVSLHTVQHTYDVSRPFSPWLMTIANRRMADAACRRYTRNANEISVDVLPETSAFHREQAEERSFDKNESLRSALASLPAAQKEAIKLLKLHGYSLEETSTITGKSIASLKVSVHRAIKSMRSILAGK